MHDSLFSRFYGCCLGLVLGETLALAHRSPAQARTTQTSNQRWSTFPLQWLTALVQAGRWDLHTCPKGILRRGEAPLSAAELAIATLPITLYFHQDLRQQRHYLGQIRQIREADPLLGQQVLVIAYVVALALRGQLQPTTLVPQVLAYLNVLSHASDRYPAPNPALVEQLHHLKTLAAQPVPLPIAAASLSQPNSDATLAIALYTFLCTPTQWQLTLTRSLTWPQATPPLVILLSLLSGAYNGAVGIPAHWQGATPPEASHSPAQLAALVTQFLALWAGVLPLSDRPIPLLQTLPISAPGRISTP